MSISTDGFIAGVAGEKKVSVAAANTAPQVPRAGLLDEIDLNVVPCLLGGASGCSTTSAPRRSTSSWCG